MPGELVSVHDVKEGVARIDLHRLSKRNALSYELDLQLRASLLSLDADPEVRCIVLASASPDFFCAGADMREDRASRGEVVAYGGGLTGVGGPMVQLCTPLVTSVAGYAIGMGCELALCGDLIVCAEDARFELPEARIGLIGDEGPVHRVIRALPPAVANGMLLAGQPLLGSDAARLGFVTAAAPADSLNDLTLYWARAVAACVPEVVMAVKRVVAQSRAEPSVADALDRTYAEIEEYRTSDAFRAALARFAR